jgi:hypothetical protein
MNLKELAMKNLLILAVLAALGGCAVAPAPANYGTRAAAYNGDPSQWRVVSVTPVAPGTGARNGSAAVEYSAAPAAVYQPAPVYAPQPVYVEPAPYYYPPVSFSLGLVFGRHWGWGGRSHRRHR